MDDNTMELTEGLDHMLELSTEYGPTMFRGALILLVVLFSAQFLGRALRRLLIRMGVPERKVLFPVTALHITTLLVGALLVLNAMGIPALNLIRILFTVAMVLVSVFIVIRPYLPGLPFSTGDLIEQGSTFGVVERITFANTMVKSIDGSRVMIPNNRLLGQSLVNYSIHPNRRADIMFFVSYDADVISVRGIVEEVLGQDERVLTEPAPVTVLKELNPSYREIMVRFWAPGTGFLATKWDVYEKIDRAICDQGIQLGVPRLEVVTGAEGATPVAG